MQPALRILIVEDSRSDVQLIREMILDTGIKHEVQWLSDGEKAMRYFLEGNSADLILLDLNIPKIDGYSVLSFLAERGISIVTPVVVMTGSNNPSDIARAKEKGASAYIIKPMTIEEIDRTTETLKRILSGIMA